MERFEKDDCYAVMFRFFVIVRRGNASTWQPHETVDFLHNLSYKEEFAGNGFEYRIDVQITFRRRLCKKSTVS
ncbi:MAG: hypothetical protein ACTJLN_03000 [Rickettsia amblyommatis]